MKQILMAVIAVVFSMLSANAQQEPIEISAGHFSRISFGDNMKVVLRVVDNKDASLNVNKEASESLNFHVSGNTLHIAPKKWMNDQIVVVLVNRVDVLSLGVNTNVDTDGILKGDKLNVFVNDNSNARLKTYAKIKGFPLGDSDVKITNVSASSDLSIGTR
jgi:hypothetical protein